MAQTALRAPDNAKHLVGERIANRGECDAQFTIADIASLRAIGRGF
jgi:hypothetical protein